MKDVFVADNWSTQNGNIGSGSCFSRRHAAHDDRRSPSARSPRRISRRHWGKVLRLRDDGTVPPDNPFVGDPGIDPEIFSTGHRNPQGLAVDPDDGRDLRNRARAARRRRAESDSPGPQLRLAAITYGKNYDDTSSRTNARATGMEQPLNYWVPSIAPSGLAVYTGDRFPKWRDNLFLGAMAGRESRGAAVSRGSVDDAAAHRGDAASRCCSASATCGRDPTACSTCSRTAETIACSGSHQRNHQVGAIGNERVDAPAKQATRVVFRVDGPHLDREAGAMRDLDEPPRDDARRAGAFRHLKAGVRRAERRPAHPRPVQRPSHFLARRARRDRRFRARAAFSTRRPNAPRQTRSTAFARADDVHDRGREFPAR